MKRIFEVNIDINGKQVKYSMDIDESLSPNVKNMKRDKDLMQKIRIEMCEPASILFGGSSPSNEVKS